MTTSGDIFYGPVRGGMSIARDAVQLPGAAPLPCGDCGSDDVRVRQRQGKGDSIAARVRCNSCGASGQLFTGRNACSAAIDDWARRPVPRAAPAPAAARRHAGTAPTPSEGKRDPLELLARMAVGGSYRLPTQGRATAVPLSAADVAGAVGLMRDPVAKQTALAVALRVDGAPLLRLGRSALRRVLRQYLQSGAQAPLRMDCPADRWRARLVLQDAVNDLVWPERRKPAQAAARAVKMRKGAYLVAYRISLAVLEHALEEGRKDFRGRLFGWY